MPAPRHIARLNICPRCSPYSVQAAGTRVFHSVAPRNVPQVPGDKEPPDNKTLPVDERRAAEKAEQGPLARRLEEATEEALLTGGSAGRRAIEDAGFSDELKEKLLDKIADAKFRKQYSGAFTQAGIASSTIESGRHRGGSHPWTGTETTEDAVLRMLNDSRKPLKPEDRGKFQPPVVDTRIRRSIPQSPGQRAASARDKAGMYVGMDMKSTKGLSSEEREEMKAELRERFQPAARSVPVSISGLTALANQRIEDAIARGQFKDLPRGKEMEQDPRANNPFIDTTEYIMNKMIQRQEIVPPWIEKQQELTKTARVFRERLRNDWKRHASRMIASRGGSLEEQMSRASAFASAEAAHNPRFKAVSQGVVSSSATYDPVMVNGLKEFAGREEQTPVEGPDSSAAVNLLQRPFRDAAWVQAEMAYMNLSIENLNSMTRSYNLMAPELAKKPYFSLERELNSCYADVAPLVANEIKVRAVGRTTVGKTPHSRVKDDSNFMEKLIGKDNVKIHLEADEKAYGLKEWWRDFWQRK